MEQTGPKSELLTEIVDRISVGVFVVNRDFELVLWNGYMENYSQTKADDVLGKNLFECFPDLPRSWLEQKIHNVFIIKNFSFTSWEHRPYLFRFLHNRPITGGIDYMRQNCTFLPMKGETGEIDHVCISIFDVTDTSIYESMLKNAVRSLAEASNRDGLTNIYNRRFLEQSMSKEFARIKRYGGKLSFIIIDLDHFKHVNDTYGHLAGDEILKIASKRIADCLRTSDILARYGGEEFAVMATETSLEGATILAERLCKNIAKEPVIFDDFEISISASLGVSEFKTDHESHEALIGEADQVLYVSKENGRNQVTVYHPGKLKMPLERVVVNNETDDSIDNQSPTDTLEENHQPTEMPPPESESIEATKSSETDKNLEENIPDDVETNADTLAEECAQNATPSEQNAESTQVTQSTLESEANIERTKTETPEEEIDTRENPNIEEVTSNDNELELAANDSTESNVINVSAPADTEPKEATNKKRFVVIGTK